MILSMHRPAALDPAPLVFADDGSVIRIAGGRLTLDTVVWAFKRGATAEEIVQDYPPISLPDVYAVIAYYLQHRSEVEEYLAKRALAHADLRRQIEDRPEYRELRERLLTRRDRTGAGST